MEQEFSRSVREIARLKALAKQKTPKKKKQLMNDQDALEVNENLGVMERGITRPFKAAPDFKKRVGESEKAFMFRVDRETAAIIQKAKFEDKYDVDVDELDNDKKPAKEAEETAINRKKKRLEQRKAKLADKKRQKKEDRCGGFAALKDDIRFGEVAHQPPTLTARPKKAPQIQTSKPGTKSLLLTKMLSGSSTTDDAICDEDAARQGGLGRRKLSPSERVMLEAERERVVQLYRAMKSQKQQGVLPS